MSKDTRIVRVRAVIVAAAAVLLLAGGTGRATADQGSEGRFAELANHERSAAGVPALATAADLGDVARRHAQRMADAGRPYHNPNLAGEVGGWRALAENVGAGGAVDPVHRAFMGSSTHREHILDGRYREVGMGVAWRDGVLYVVQVFREPVATAQSAPPPPPPPPPAPPPPPPEPAPAPEPQPAPAPPPPAPAAQAPAPAPPPAPAAPAGAAPAPPTTAATQPSTTASAGVEGTPLPGPATEAAPAAPSAAPMGHGVAPFSVAAVALIAMVVAAQVAFLRRQGLTLPALRRLPATPATA